MREGVEAFPYRVFRKRSAYSTRFHRLAHSQRHVVVIVV